MRHGLQVPKETPELLVMKCIMFSMKKKQRGKDLSFGYSITLANSAEIFINVFIK
jgi:hypothetical protein